MYEGSRPEPLPFPLAAIVISGMVVAAIGPLIAWMFTETLREANAAQEWPSARAHMVSSSVDMCRYCNGPRFHVTVTYEYWVGDQSFTGRNLRFGSDAFDTGHDAQQAVGRYTAGTPVYAYYNPERPGESVLDTAFYLPIGDRITVGASIVVSGLALLLCGRCVAQAVNEGRNKGV